MTSEDLSEADRERQVRRTAQRLIKNLLPYGQNPDQRTYHLDLTGASLEYFRLEEGARIGRLTARQARFYGIRRLSEMYVSDRALFTRATFLGRVDLSGTQFGGGISFPQTIFHDEVASKGASVSVFVDLNTAAPKRQVGTLTITEGTDVKGDTSHWSLG